jgi:hypothetical protein
MTYAQDVNVAIFGPGGSFAPVHAPVSVFGRGARTFCDDLRVKSAACRAEIAECPNLPVTLGAVRDRSRRPSFDHSCERIYHTLTLDMDECRDLYTAARNYRRCQFVVADWFETDMRVVLTGPCAPVQMDFEVFLDFVYSSSNLLLAAELRFLRMLSRALYAGKLSHRETEFVHAETPALSMSLPMDSPVYQPSSPVYQPSSPVYQPSSPVYQPSSPVYQPSSPVYRSDSPYRPESPVYRSDSPYRPESPEYRPGSPEYRPERPECSLDSPEYTPGSPSYRSDSPYRPECPEYTPDSPYRPESPEYTPDSPYRPESPEYTSSSMHTD